MANDRSINFYVRVEPMDVMSAHGCPFVRYLHSLHEKTETLLVHVGSMDWPCGGTKRLSAQAHCPIRQFCTARILLTQSTKYNRLCGTLSSAR